AHPPPTRHPAPHRAVRRVPLDCACTVPLNLPDDASMPDHASELSYTCGECGPIPHGHLTRARRLAMVKRREAQLQGQYSGRITEHGCIARIHLTDQP